MTTLRGFRCDNCHGESIEDKPGRRWIEVRSLSVTSDGWSSLAPSDGLHYCSRACLRMSMETKWEQAPRASALPIRRVDGGGQDTP